MTNISFKTAFRSLTKRKGFSLLNILGLAIGMTCCLLIFHYVSYQRNFDQFSEHANDIVRLRLDSYQQGVLAWKSATSYPAFGPTMKKDFPEVIDYCRLYDFEKVLANTETNIKYAETKGYLADPSALSMLGVQLIKGDAGTALREVKSIVLSETTAKKYFGNADPLGKRLQIRDVELPTDNDLLVTGVFKDYPVNSHLIINYLVSYNTLQYQLNKEGDSSNTSNTNFGWYDFYTYLQLAPGTDLKKFESKLPAYCDRYINNNDWNKKSNVKNALSVIPLKDIHLYSNFNQEAEVNGNGQSVSFLFLIAIFILGIAWVNYINLATARSVERAKEVGVRKVMGAQRSSLIQQFLTESLLLNLVSLILSSGLFFILLKPFDTFTGHSEFSFYTMNITYWVWFGLMFFLGTLLSGIYPAFVLSGFQPVTVLKGIFKNSGSGVVLRKSLIITQFVASVILITGTMVVYRQLKYMRGSDLGADLQQTLIVEGVRSVGDSAYNNFYQPFKNELLQGNSIKSVASSTSVMGKEIYWTNGVRRLDVPDATSHTMYNMGIDYDFIPAYQIRMLSGRNFSKEFSTDNKGVILTESGAKELGFTDMAEAVNKKLRRGGDTVHVIGVAASYHHQGLQKSLDPMLIVLRPNSRNFYSIKLEKGDPSKSLSRIESTWNKYFPSDPFNYYFLDESFNEQYKGEMLFGKVFGIFSLLGIIIACFGLLGLSAYNVLQRTKEIGIRKVIGASEQGILMLLTGDFIKLILFALVIGIPLSWLLMHKWLSGYAFRTSMPWWIFAGAGSIALMIAFATISIQAIKAIKSKPVTSLRTE